MADPIPSAPPSLAKAKAQDIALLEEDARRFLTRERPATDALTVVLQRPADQIIAEYRELLWRNPESGPHNVILDAAGNRLYAGPSGFLALANTVVAKAILGDMGAAENVMSRIEGSPGKRKLDSDEEFERRAEMVQSLEAIVREMNRRPGDDAKVIEGKANGHDQKPNGSDK